MKIIFKSIQGGILLLHLNIPKFVPLNLRLPSKIESQLLQKIRLLYNSSRLLPTRFAGCVINPFLHPMLSTLVPRVNCSRFAERLVSYFFSFLFQLVQREACTLHGAPTNNGDPVAQLHRQSNTPSSRTRQVRSRFLFSAEQYRHFCRSINYTDNFYLLFSRKNKYSFILHCML